MMKVRWFLIFFLTADVFFMIQSFQNSFFSMNKWKRMQVQQSPIWQSKLLLVKPETKEYDANAITVLTGLEPVRKRPGMYIGSTGSKGLHHLVFEVLDNSIDEALGGHCNDISLILHADGKVEVRDNGRGIPCETHPMTGKSTLETVLCVLHAGGKFGGEASGYKVSGGLHGVGISVVNALSDYLLAEVVRDGQFNQMKFSKGDALGPIHQRKALVNETRGTRIIFHPDKEIFKSTSLEFDYDILATRIDELAYLNPGLMIKVIDQRQSAVDQRNKTHIFQHNGGISELIEHICTGKASLHPAELPVISIKEEKKNISVDIAMRWSSDQYDDNVFGFANGIRTSDGGSHLDGMKAAITRIVNAFAKKTGKMKEGSISGEFVREGLTAVVSVKVPEPEFEGQTKTRLGNPEVRQIVDNIVYDGLQKIFEWNPNFFNAICSKAISAMNAAAAAKAARDVVRRKSLLQSTVLPGKLSDCSSRNASEGELFIVEGDSAAGSAKLGRDRKFQAILPLKGKILNIEKATNEKIYQNSELQALITATGLGTRGSALDLEQLRYHRIVIMTDADVDGAHIRLLLLTFFYRYQRELFDRGMIYVACPPLYKVSWKEKGKEQIRYFYSQEEYDEFLLSSSTSTSSKQQQQQDSPQLQQQSHTFQTQRFKGLGEMMPLQLWETTMDPSRRRMKLVTVDDATTADRMFRVLMGDEIQERKAFIVNNVDRLNLSDLDY